MASECAFRLSAASAGPSASWYSCLRAPCSVVSRAISQASPGVGLLSPFDWGYRWPFQQFCFTRVLAALPALVSRSRSIPRLRSVSGTGRSLPRRLWVPGSP